MLLGGRDFWSNGIHLNVIEASADPAEESWRNINAMDDLVHEVINTMSHVVIAGMRGNAGAGGAILALAADQVFARPSVVLNPHYRSMGNSTVRNIGPICFQSAWGRQKRWNLRRAASLSAHERLARSAFSMRSSEKT